jgi:energy-converting hydrogenase Eha subunit A
MEQQISRLRAITLVRFLSLVLAGFGVGVLIHFIIGLAHDFQHPPTATSLLVELVFGSLNMAVGVWLLWVAWLGWNHRSAAAIRWLAAALCTVIPCVGLVLGGTFRVYGARKPSDSSLHESLEFLAAPLVVGLYFFLYRLLTTRLDLKDERSVQQQKRSVERSLGLGSREQTSVGDLILGKV